MQQWQFYMEKCSYNFINATLITSYFKFPFLKHSYCSHILFVPRLIWKNTRTIKSLFYVPHAIITQ